MSRPVFPWVCKYRIAEHGGFIGLARGVGPVPDLFSPSLHQKSTGHKFIGCSSLGRGCLVLGVQILGCCGIVYGGLHRDDGVTAPIHLQGCVVLHVPLGHVGFIEQDCQDVLPPVILCDCAIILRLLRNVTCRGRVQSSFRSTRRASSTAFGLPEFPSDFPEDHRQKSPAYNVGAEASGFCVFGAEAGWSQLRRRVVRANRASAVALPNQQRQIPRG